MRRRLSLLCGALALVGASGCAGPRIHYAYRTPPAAPPPPPAPPPPAPAWPRPEPVWCESGQATYYADRFAGRRTANGERYDPRLYTAAHRTWPLGTLATVSRPELGRSVRVRINDRGPYAPGAFIDLSRAAAEALGMVRAGRVAVTVCRG